MSREKENKCNHSWKVIAVWGVNTFFVRRECQVCKIRQDASIAPNEWKNSPQYILSEQVAKGFNLLTK